MSDFLLSSSGELPQVQWRRSRKVLRFLDTIVDARVALRMRRLEKAMQQTATMSVLIAATEVSGREADLARVIERIRTTTRHDVNVAVTPMEPMGKFDNINRAISGLDWCRFDWLLIVDDDISMPDHFLDVLLYFASTHNLKLAQPAHRFVSYSTYAVTERHFGSLARRTGFVEIGPVSLLHRDTFSDLLPFARSRWAWGIDAFWADIARRQGWKMGIIDAVPIQHLRPIGKSYDVALAQKEGIAFLAKHRVVINRREMFSVNERIA